MSLLASEPVGPVCRWQSAAEFGHQSEGKAKVPALDYFLASLSSWLANYAEPFSVSTLPTCSAPLPFLTHQTNSLRETRCVLSRSVFYLVSTNCGNCVVLFLYFWGSVLRTSHATGSLFRPNTLRNSMGFFDDRLLCLSLPTHLFPPIQFPGSPDPHPVFAEVSLLLLQ